MADQKLTALSEVSVPALTDLAYWVADPGGTPTSDKITGTRLGGLFVPALCQGRLTTESGVPVSTSDRTAQGTLYWTPCTPTGIATSSGLVGFYDGTRYVVKSLTEISLSLTITTGLVYDIFLDWNSGTPQLVKLVWASSTTRATALAGQGSLVVLSGTTTYRWVGTIQASNSNVVEDSLTKRYVWNAYNQMPRPMLKQLSGTWSYTSQTVRPANNDATNRVEYVTGDAASRIVASVNGTALINGNPTYGGSVGVGVDSTSAYASAGCRGGFFHAAASNDAMSSVGVYRGYPGLGYHYLICLEQGASSSCTFLGSDTDSGTLGGIESEILA